MDRPTPEHALRLYRNSLEKIAPHDGSGIVLAMTATGHTQVIAGSPDELPEAVRQTAVVVGIDWALVSMDSRSQLVDPSLVHLARPSNEAILVAMVDRLGVQWVMIQPYTRDGASIVWAEPEQPAVRDVDGTAAGILHDIWWAIHLPSGM